MTVNDWVYLNGAFVRREEASVSPFDRGFLFAHSAYEVTAIVNGQVIDFDGHLARLSRTLAGLEITAPNEDLTALHKDLIDRNGVREGLIYLQVTAGEHGPRDFSGPETLTPGLFLFTTPKSLIGTTAKDGISAISLPDTRWSRRDMKTTQLLSQSLAYRAARRAGADTAIMHEDGLVTEAASANAWIIDAGGTLITRDLSSALLAGITRDSLLRLMHENGFKLEERAFTIDEMRRAAEAFTSSTGVMIAPLIALDHDAIGSGRPGPVTRQVQRLYYSHIGADIASLDWL